MSFGVVVVAAGRSSRFGRDKLFLEVEGRPVLAWTLLAFEACPSVDEVALVMSPENAEAGRALLVRERLTKVRHFRLGGARRQDSVLAGLRALDCEWVGVHDGARPLVTRELIERGLAAARETGAAVPGVPLKDTVKLVDESGTIVATPDRALLRAIQTPQVFRRDLLLDAHARTPGDVTDDAALLEALGHPVKVFAGDYANVKITTAEDVDLAERLLRRRLHPTAVRADSVPTDPFPGTSEAAETIDGDPR